MSLSSLDVLPHQSFGLVLRKRVRAERENKKQQN